MSKFPLGYVKNGDYCRIVRLIRIALCSIANRRLKVQLTNS